MMKIITAFTCLLSLSGFSQLPVETPDVRYGDLFKAVQMQRIFPDGKTFVDCVPKRAVSAIMADYNARKGGDFNLTGFVLENFDLPKTPPVINYIREEKDVKMHITNLWNTLSREPDEKLEGSSLLPLPFPYIVPGGRFREIYYWDSYFTMLGLRQSGRVDMIENMVKNFAFLIDTYGHIPNGNRSYYLSRSQPPFFALMVELLAGIKGKGVYAQFNSQLQKEYYYWMAGSPGPEAGAASLRLVKMPGGEMLNRYWDESATPRQESYREDVLAADTAVMHSMMTMRFSSREAMDNYAADRRAEIYHHLRAGAASGWDFSSRWFADGMDLFSIQTTDIVPVDLNCLIYQLEITLGKACAANGQAVAAREMNARAARRAKAIQRYCFNGALKTYTDFNWKTRVLGNLVTPAAMFAFCLLPVSQVKPFAAVTAQLIRTQLLKAGGIATSSIRSQQQWDAPNGWAPLQWMTIWGFERMGQNTLAATIAHRWIKLNKAVYQRTGKLMEKYDVENISLDAGGGEYPGQDGFGWTNGVLLALLAKYGG